MFSYFCAARARIGRDRPRCSRSPIGGLSEGCGSSRASKFISADFLRRTSKESTTSTAPPWPRAMPAAGEGSGGDAPPPQQRSGPRTPPLVPPLRTGDITADPELADVGPAGDSTDYDSASPGSVRSTISAYASPRCSMPGLFSPPRHTRRGAAPHVRPPAGHGVQSRTLLTPPRFCCRHQARCEGAGQDVMV